MNWFRIFVVMSVMVAWGVPAFADDEAPEGIIRDTVSAEKAWSVNGDFRFRVDSTHVKFEDGDAGDDNVLINNRVRFNVKVRATEQMTFKARLAMYKLWGHSTPSPIDIDGVGGPIGNPFDGNTANVPEDSTLRLDRAYVNWSEPGGFPGWISIGRRPSAGGPPRHLSRNTGRDATPSSLGVDFAFDGATFGWAPEIDALPGFKSRICYGKGFESGLRGVLGNDLDDANLIGLNIDVLDDPDEDVLFNIQIFRAFDMIGLPSDDPNVDANIGDVDHATFVYMRKTGPVDWFLSGGASITHPGDLQTVDFMGMSLPMGLLNSPDPVTGLVPDDSHTGYAAYAGLRIPVPALKSKIGLEFNYGSKNWVTFTPAADDIYGSKLATRGHVTELYWIYDIPQVPLTPRARAFFRLGLQHYDYRYTGSGTLLGAPVDLAEARSMGLNPIDTMNNIYGTFELFF